MKPLLSAVTLAILMSACQQKSSPSDSPVAAGTPGTFQAVCDLYGQSQQPMLCIDFPTNTTANENSCETTEVSNYSAEGVDGSAYIGVTSSGASVSCVQNNAGQSEVGSCQLSDRTIRYYSGSWTAQTAQSNCTSRSGQWSAT